MTEITMMPTAKQLFHFTDDLEASLRYNLNCTFDCESILLCGMGGSAISSDVVAECCFIDSKKPIHVLKYPCLPAWVGPSTLTVISSYSGKTSETLEMYHQALAKNCQVIIITSGGALRQEAIQHSNRLIILPEGMHPRHAIGYMIGYTAAIVRAAGGPDMTEQIESFIPALRDYRDAISKKKSGGQAWDLAQAYRDNIPIICSDNSMRAVVLRWKTQLNENSKKVAFCAVIPELNHCGLKAYLSREHPKYLPTIIENTNDRMCRYAQTIVDTERAMTKNNIRFERVTLGGQSSIENMMRAIILGDYTSMFLAEIRGIDPSDVPAVTQLKVKLGEVPSQNVPLAPAGQSSVSVLSENRTSSNRRSPCHD